jgi:hypothetical protein
MQLDHFKMLIENDKEWRGYMIQKIEALHQELSVLKAWSLAFRLFGSAAFAILLIWVEVRLTK